MDDLEIMQQVERLAGPYLDAFAPSSSVPESFWAALTANESAGVFDAKRFEPGVYAHLQAVAAGEVKAYGSITLPAITSAEETARAETYHAQILDAAWAAAHQAELAALDDATLRSLATSWGFTQVMGYHSLEWRRPLAEIVVPATHYQTAARLMASFSSVYGLDPTADFEAMARCWNGGHPTAKTWDPNYVPNLLRRMQVWDSL